MYHSFRKVEVKRAMLSITLLRLFVYLPQYNVWLGIRRVCAIILNIYIFADVHLS